MSSVGAIAPNLHQGSRSEILADYLFSSWGTVTPVRRADDHGVDLYCTLTEARGKRAFVSEYFTVQVKSSQDSWHFSDPDSVRWLVENPLPLFLAVVDKKGGLLRVYHTLPRFDAAGFPPLPSELTLQPETVHHGTYTGWSGKPHWSLSAPIIEVTIADLLESSKMTALRDVFRQWVRIDRHNGDLARQGLFRFRMPDTYNTNEAPCGSTLEMGNAAPPLDSIRRGIVSAAEAAECVAGQLCRGQGDRDGAVFGAMFVDHLQRRYPDAFFGHPRWNGRVPGDLGIAVNDGLREPGAAEYRLEGLDRVAESVKQHPRVARYRETSPSTVFPVSGTETQA